MTPNPSELTKLQQDDKDTLRVNTFATSLKRKATYELQSCYIFYQSTSL